MTNLIDGAWSIRQREYSGDRQIISGLATGQRPAVMMIACSDARIDPALIFGIKPGDVSMSRDVANPGAAP